MRRDADSAPWGALTTCANADLALAALPGAAAFDWRQAVLKGGLPPTAIAASDDDRARWLENYVETFVRRDLGDLLRKESFRITGRVAAVALGAAL